MIYVVDEISDYQNGLLLMVSGVFLFPFLSLLNLEIIIK